MGLAVQIAEEVYEVLVHNRPETRARCADEGEARWFFSDDQEEQTRAKALCWTCPRQAACLADAIMRSESDGIWGGFLPDERGLYVAIFGPEVGDSVRPLPMAVYVKAGRRKK